MRSRALVALALFSVPLGLGAQVRPPRTATRTPLQPASPPPAAPIVGRELAYQRSRWSSEGYALYSTIRVPVSDGVVNYSTVGSGTRGSYRFGERVSATIDLTVSPLGGSAITETAEAGARYSAPPDGSFRPFADVRAGFMHMFDQFQATSGPPPFGGFGQFGETSRYSRGFGAVAGIGIEHSLTSSLALSTELSGMRSKMTAYHVSAPTSIPGGARSYWATTFRFGIGLKYNRTRALYLAQNPR